MTSETWSEQVALDALREQRRRYHDDPRMAQVDEFAASLADRLTEHTTVAAADGASILLLAGACLGPLTAFSPKELPATVLVELLQVTAVELDRRAREGEAS